MRADRLISILLLLQIHTRITARELAHRLEVSERTVHRDMEALSMAGIPVFAERGAGGGWSLTENYKTNLNGLNDTEVQALFLTRPPRLLADLGTVTVNAPPRNFAAAAPQVRVGAVMGGAIELAGFDMTACEVKTATCNLQLANLQTVPVGVLSIALSQTRLVSASVTKGNHEMVARIASFIRTHAPSSTHPWQRQRRPGTAEWPG